MTLEFRADGSLTADYQDWLITAVTESLTVTIRPHGVDQGSFSVTDTTITFEDTAVGSTMKLRGSGIDMPIDPMPISYTDAAYSCDVSTMSVTTSDGTLQLSR